MTLEQIRAEWEHLERILHDVLGKTRLETLEAFFEDVGKLCQEPDDLTARVNELERRIQALEPQLEHQALNYRLVIDSEQLTVYKDEDLWWELPLSSLFYIDTVGDHVAQLSAAGSPSQGFYFNTCQERDSFVKNLKRQWKPC